jgi:hypothetical protein
MSLPYNRQRPPYPQQTRHIIVPHIQTSNSLEEMGQPQPPTPLKTDNTASTGYSNDTIKQRHTRAMDMIFYWVKDRVKQSQFRVYWGPGNQHMADYFTKQLSPEHHKRMWEMYIHASVRTMSRAGIQDSALLGCANTQDTAGSNATHLLRGRWYISPMDICYTSYNLL